MRLLAVLLLLPLVAAQSLTSLSLTTSHQTITTISRSGGQDIPITTTLARVFNVTVTPSVPLPTSTPAPIVLDTKLDPAFAVIGALLVVTGIPSAFWGHKNRW